LQTSSWVHTQVRQAVTALGVLGAPGSASADAARQGSQAVWVTSGPTDIFVPLIVGGHNPRCSECKSGPMFHPAHRWGPCSVPLPGGDHCPCTAHEQSPTGLSARTQRELAWPRLRGGTPMYVRVTPFVLDLAREQEVTASAKSNCSLRYDNCLAFVATPRQLTGLLGAGSRSPSGTVRNTLRH